MKTLGKYKIQEEIGSGGFGRVYRAIDITLDREIALKVLHPQLTVDAYFLEKFRDEAKLVATLDSPNIVTIHDFGEVDGYVFFAMRYMRGGSLKDRLEKEGAIPYSKTKKVFEQVCEGLQVAHEKDMIHRDIKPDNILFDLNWNAVVSDFGLAKIVQQSSMKGSISLGGVGTPVYRAPELWEGDIPASTATDVYALGCVLCEMLTGKVLFDGATPEKVYTQHLVRGPQIPEKFPADIPVGIREVLEKAMAKAPQDRYQTAGEFAEALEVLDAFPKKDDGLTNQPVLSSEVEREEAPSTLEPKRETVEQLIESIKKRENREDKEGKTIGDPPPSPKWPIILGGIAVLAAIVWFLISGGDDSTADGVGLKAGGTQVSSKDGMTIVYVPEGEFIMGSDDGQNDESPVHTVYLDAFWIDQTEVTNAMYRQCVEAGICDEPSDVYFYNDDLYGDHPVVYVNWDDADTYCNWAGRRLPTEAEWEKAARSTVGWVYPWGDVFTGLYLNYCDRLCPYGWKDEKWSDGFNRIAEVGSYPKGASRYGALDMLGNVWEWTADWYDKDYYSISPSENPMGPEKGIYKVMRGGSWSTSIDSIRSSNRNQNFSSSMDIYDGDIGFRCVLPAK